MEQIVKAFLSIILLTTLAQSKMASATLQKSCLECHIKQQIPSELIYRRYLLKYSTHNKIRKTLFAYLQNPKEENSIMPKQFFLKFPQKESLDLNETILKREIEEYLEFFDVREKFVLP